MAKQNAKGRTKSWVKHIRVESYEFNCPAFRSLHPYAKAILLELRWRYNGQNNGDIHFGIESAKKAIGVGRKAVERGFKELQEKGFVRVAQKGAFKWKMRHETTWILNNQPLGDSLPTKDFIRWEPGKNFPVYIGNADGVPREHRRAKSKVKNLPHGVPQEHRKNAKPSSNGVPREHTNNIPRGEVLRDWIDLTKQSCIKTN